jgi:hypothetical protein
MTEQLLENPRFNFVADDGRHLLRAGPAHWDIVYSDVATYAQYVELGTVEFFALVRDKLAPGGMFALKVHGDTLSDEGMRHFVATFVQVFPDAMLFDLHGPMPVLVGWKDTPDPAAVEQRLASAEGYEPGAGARVLETPVLTGAPLLALVEGRRPGTDDRPRALRQALYGPVTEDTRDRSAEDALERAFRSALPAGQVLLGQDGGAVHSHRTRAPRNPPRRDPWFLKLPEPPPR